MKLKFITGILLLTNLIKAQVPTTWTVNPASYSNQMYITAQANEACVTLTNTNNYVAAFVGSQCRAVAQTSLIAGGNYIGNLTIHSNLASGEKIKFKIYNSVTNQVKDVLDSIVFSQNTTLGNPLTPFVLNTNHAPNSLSLSTLTVTENSALATTVATLSATDQDGTTTFNYSLTATQPENTEFAIAGNLLQVNTNYDYETDATKIIELKVDDNGGCSYAQTYTITIIDANDAPTALTHTVPTIFDSQQANSYMGKFFTTDQDTWDVHTYSLVTGVGSTDNSQFHISNDTLYNNSQIDYAAQSVYYIRARTTDLGGLFIENTFTLNVTNVNDAPTDISLSTFTVNENSAFATLIATMSVTDADPGDTHTITVEAGAVDNTLVSVSGNSLQVNGAINFELNPTLEIKLRATDLAGAYYVKDFTLTVNDVNDAPTDIALPADSVAELQPLATLVSTLTTTDEDAGATHSYALVAGAGDTDNALFAINGNSLVTNATYTFTGQTYSIRLRTTDNGGLTFEKIFSIKIINTNEVPNDIIIDSAFVMEDNVPDTYLSQLKTIDPDFPDKHTYALVAGAGDTDNTQFNIIGKSLFMITKTNFDVKDEYQIRIKTTDSLGLSYEEAFIIKVKDIAGNNIPLPSTNYISPNDDGKNDFWKIEEVENYKTFALKIFDQYGQVIFSKPDNYNNEWDGKYNGKPLPTGNYYYEFKKETNNKSFKGNITIIN